MISFRIGRSGINLFNSQKILFVLWLFLLVFPKGGFKIAGIPITWGYLLLGIFSLFVLFQKKWTFHLPRIQAFLCLIPFQFISLCTILLNGIENLGISISFFTSFFFLPFAFLILFSKEIENLDLPKFFTLYKKGIFFIACYGIFLFFFKSITGKFIEIPFITTNLGDLGGLEHKHINRGSVFKLISTYNNGNIFGVCLMIMLPLYCYLEKSGWRVLLTKTAILLTFSRSVWACFLFHEVLFGLFGTKKPIIKSLTFICFAILFFIGIGYYYQFPVDFFFDPSMGGRTGNFKFIEHFSLFSNHPFCGIHELVYYWVYYSFGLIGLILFLLAMIGPLFVYFGIYRNNIRRVLILGIVNYLFISISEGAMLFIPTMAIFWFFISLLGRKSLDPLETHWHQR